MDSATFQGLSRLVFSKYPDKLYELSLLPSLRTGGKKIRGTSPLCWECALK